MRWLGSFVLVFLIFVFPPLSPPNTDPGCKYYRWPVYNPGCQSFHPEKTKIFIAMSTIMNLYMLVIQQSTLLQDFKGVRGHGRRYRVDVSLGLYPGQKRGAKTYKLPIGCRFDTEREAALEHDKAYVALHGYHPNELNFPDEIPIQVFSQLSLHHSCNH